MRKTSASTLTIGAAFAVFSVAFGFSGIAHGQERGFQALNPAALPPAHGYSHIVIAPVGRLVTLSGQVSMDSKGEIVGKGDFKAQCDQVFRNIREALQAVGLTFGNVTRTDMFVTDLGHLSDLRECRTRYLPARNPPAANLVKVDSLFRPELMLEISVQAVIPQRTEPR
ncbi:RidA family protein [Frateuria sp. STR12]|uniref:RidA family protein n=1 Tax=Frateuria hangzhouensis TaxID=2995589 RepID=UPI002260AA46|nr:RidA family protein [Frateuria sp. STR12]MCX7514489.1 RidA family protein [Frateuria sp. STR12]